jgi:transcriptional regulator of acetoin/glycerol metabolism
MVLLAEGDTLCPSDLPFGPVVPAPAVEAVSVAADDHDGERLRITDAIHAEQGNITRAAARLGIAKSSLYVKMNRFGLRRTACVLPAREDS